MFDSKNPQRTPISDLGEFGLIGHLIEMCKASDVSAELDFNSIPFFPGTQKLADDELIPSGSKRNHDHVSNYCYYYMNILLI